MLDVSKHKGNRWISYGIINSLKSRDNKLLQLQKLKQGSPEYCALKQNISVFNAIIKKIIREAKMKYYHEAFERNKHDVKRTWKNISELLSKSSKATNPIKELRVNGNTVNTMTEICNNLPKSINQSMLISVMYIIGSG